MSELRLPWHAGRTTGRALYDGDGPDDLIGVMDTRELAAAVVEAVNAVQRPAPPDLSTTSIAGPSSAQRGAQEQPGHILSQTQVATIRQRADFAADSYSRSNHWTQQQVDVLTQDIPALCASHAALTARLAVVEQSAPRSEYPEVDAQLAVVCIPCFEGICDMCIEERGRGGDGQPCRCHHGRYYAKRLAAVEGERDGALAGLVHGWRASDKFAAWGRSLAEAYHNTRGHPGHWAACPTAPCRGPVVDRRLEPTDGR